jgi:phage gp45-like
MHKATPNNTSLRAYSSGGSRGIVDTIDDNKLMQEHSGQMMNSEARDGVESPQNYGHTSCSFPAEKDGQGNITGSAENHISYSGGNRSFPVGGAMDDRRHRLRGLSPGDSAVNRGKDDDMQIHLASDGMYHSAPQMCRMQLVASGSGKANAPQQKPQAAKATQAQQVQLSLYARNGPHIEARLWAGLEPELQLELDGELVRELARIGIEARVEAGGGVVVAPFAESGGAGSSGGTGANGGGQGNKPTGQKAVNGAGKDSADFMHVKKGEGRLSSKDKVRLSTGKEDDDVLHEASNKKNYVGGTPAKHKFSKILTLAGPSVNGYAKIG